MTRDDVARSIALGCVLAAACVTEAPLGALDSGSTGDPGGDTGTNPTGGETTSVTVNEGSGESTDGSSSSSSSSGDADTTMSIDPTSTSDETTDASTSTGAEEVQNECYVNDEYFEYDYFPTPGVATVTLYYYDPSNDPTCVTDLVGPVHVAAHPVIGCRFQLEPGHYELTTTCSGNEVATAEIDLADDTHQLVTSYAGHGDTTFVTPLDLTPTGNGDWRFVFLNVAQDHIDDPIDVYAYGPGVTQPDDSAALIVDALPFGESITVEVPADTLLVDFEGAGDPIETTWDVPLLECATEFLVAVPVTCDSGDVKGMGPCSGTVGPAWMGFSLTGLSCAG